jgi:hypothetical protein
LIGSAFSDDYSLKLVKGDLTVLAMESRIAALRQAGRPVNRKRRWLMRVLGVCTDLQERYRF